METIATGFNHLAIDLETHIRFYKAGKMTVPINDFSHLPRFLPKDAKKFFKAHKEGTLEETLKEMGKQDDSPSGLMRRWYIQEAIMTFFTEEKYVLYADELV
jgi:hypothetical protein